MPELSLYSLNNDKLDKDGTAVNSLKVNGLTVETAVPIGAKFTDTIYTHPANHPATVITQDANNRFVTDTEKGIWNAKASTAVVTTSANGLMTSTDKIKLDGITSNATKVESSVTNGNIKINGAETTVYTLTNANIIASLGYTPLNSNLKGANSGLAELDATGKLISSQLPPLLNLGETSSTAYRGDRGKIAYDHSQFSHARTDATFVENSVTNGNIKINGVEQTIYTHPTGTNPHGTTKSDVGLGNVSNALQATKAEFDTHVADYIRQPGYGTASGTDAKTITLSPAPTSYTEGMAISFKNVTQNAGAVTLNVNGLGAKSVLKSNGSVLTSGSLKANSIYTVRYNGVNFILQGEGGEYGTAQPQDVIMGKTIGTDSGLVTGTMPIIEFEDISEENIEFSSGAIAILPSKGYWDGSSARLHYANDGIQPYNIKSGVAISDMRGTFTSDANATSADIVEGMTAYVNGEMITGSIGCSWEESGVSAIVLDQASGYVYSDDYYSIFETTANARKPYVVRDGDMIQVAVEGLFPNVIRSNYNLFGMKGTFTSDADATIGDIAYGKTAYVKGNKITGKAVTYEPGEETFLTSTTWTAPFTGNIDVFLVGGGGGGGSNWYGGGGGGYTKTVTVPVIKGNSYSVIVGAGGSGGTTSKPAGSDGGYSQFIDFQYRADGGKGAVSYTGGAGGSGGGGGVPINQDTQPGGAGGFNGSNGGNGYAGVVGGAGQGVSTKDWNGKDYAAGGAGPKMYPQTSGGGGNGGSNSDSGGAGYDGKGGGGGGGGAIRNGGNGGSGVVIIKWGK